MKPKFFSTPAEFRKWLEQNHDKQSELMIGFHKKASGKKSITYPEALDERNYLLFGVLAGVRCFEVTPIAPRRGLPDGMTSEWDQPDDDDAAWLGEHSYSWVTLRELEAYPWDGLRWHVQEGAVQEWRHWWEGVQQFIDEALPWLRTLGEPDDVRLAFGFDS